MPVGTRTLLFGCHQFIIHPVFVLLASWRLFGLRYMMNWREWLAAFVHDWGYWGCADIDGIDGAHHPIRSVSGTIVSRILGTYMDITTAYNLRHYIQRHSWFAITKIYMESIYGVPEPFLSRLYYSDKLGSAMVPSWLWATQAWLTGEGVEYLQNSHHKYDALRGLSTEECQAASWYTLYKFHRGFKRWAHRSMEGWQVECGVHFNRMKALTRDGAQTFWLRTRVLKYDGTGISDKEVYGR
jgi:hypothetical protein